MKWQKKPLCWISELPLASCGLEAPERADSNMATASGFLHSEGQGEVTRQQRWSSQVADTAAIRGCSNTKEHCAGEPI